jgi:hypothetical protein
MKNETVMIKKATISLFFEFHLSLLLLLLLHIGDSSCARLGLGSVYSMPRTRMVGMKP